MTATVAKVPTAARVESIETRTHDLELAVLELASVVERLVVGGKHWKGEERKLMLTAVDNARALATPEDGDDDPEPEPAGVFGVTVIESDAIPPQTIGVLGVSRSRYWIDFRNGNGKGTDDLDIARLAFATGQALNILDREQGDFLVFQGKAQSTRIHAQAA